MGRNDWRYTEDRLELRGECLNILLKRFGSAHIDKVGYSTQDIYECVDVWVSQGNKQTNGLVAFFLGYFVKDEIDKEDSEVHH
jgi:hypothetical protein|tara:strand:- start:743 stop:991 length:249 start_codon:yes stop_codon:yes gene_type:complete